MEEIAKEDITFDDHFVTLQEENYDKGNRRLKIERIHLFNRKVVDQKELNFDLSSIVTLGLVKLHQVGGEALANFVCPQRVENFKLKEKIKYLEDSLFTGLY